MTIDDKTKDAKVQYEITRKAEEIAAWSSVKFDKSKNLIREVIFSSDQKRLTERAEFTYSPLGKAFEKQTKTFDN